MVYHISQPSIQLSKFIKHYWTLENCMPDGNAHIQRIVPSGLMELIFYFHDRPESTDRNRSMNENTLITGQLSEYYDIKVSGRISLFSIIFQPHGLAAFLEIPLQELVDQHVPLQCIFKKDVHEVESRLCEAKTFEDRIAIVENYFYRLLKNKEIKHNYERISHSIGKINQSKGMVDIDALAGEACYSRKQFERNFSYLVGTTPKQFLRVVRFQHAIAIKSNDNAVNLTDLTYQCGYYDQAHMINDFQKLSGMTPRQFFSDSTPYSDYFQ